MKKLALVINETKSLKEMVRYAAMYAKDFNATFNVLYIENPINYGAYGHAGMTTPPDPIVTKQMAKDVNEELAKTIKEIKNEVSVSAPIGYELETGSTSVILQEKIENQSYDWVMVQSETDQEFFLQNSVIMEIIQNVPCPVYIIPPDAVYQPYKKIIYATDYNEEDITTLKNLLNLTKPFEPEIIALHISDDNEFEIKLKKEGFAKILSEKTGNQKVSVKMIGDKKGEDAVERLIGEAEKAKADLIVVLKENRNFFERLFKSSFTAALVKESKLPVLVFQQDN